MNPPENSRYVVVTGCSSGIGRMTAVQLAKIGWNVIAGVRRPEDAQSLAQEQPNSLTPVLLDIASSDSVDSACDWIAMQTQGRGVCGLVNNAGILIPGPLELISTQQLQQQFDVNVFGTHRLTQKLIPLLRQAAQPSRSSRLILISSISGRITPPFFGAYAASKHALEALGAAWRSELSPWNIDVCVVQPTV